MTAQLIPTCKGGNSVIYKDGIYVKSNQILMGETPDTYTSVYFYSYQCTYK